MIVAAQQEMAAATLDRDAIMKLATEQAQKLTRADGAAIEMVEGDEMVCRAVSGVMASQQGMRLPVAESLSGSCVRADQIIRCDDAAADGRLDYEICRQLGVRSIILVPLLQQYNSIGVLKVLSLRPAAFDETDVQTLQLVAHFMAAAVNQTVAVGAKQSLLAEHTRTIVALRESEARFRSAFDYAAIGMALVATDGRWMKVNHTLCEIIGYSEPELRALTFQILIHPEDQDPYLGQARRLLAAEIGAFQMEMRYYHKSGSAVWVLLSVSLLRDGTGKPLYFIAQVQDITERKRVEETKARLTAILETTTDFVGTADVDGRTLYLNRAFREIVGFGPHEQVNGKHISEYHPAWAAELITKVALPAAIRDGTWSGETSLISHDGREIPISQVLIAHRTANVQVAYFSTVARDITERKRAEEALIMQARVLQNMSEGVCLADENGVIVYTNAAMERMFGYTAEELRARHVAALNSYGPENSRILSVITDRVKASGTWSGEFQNRKKDGQIFTTASSISSLEISGRKYFVSVQEDITEKKRSDEQIRNSLREKDVLLKEIHHRVKNNLQVISSLLNLQSGYVQDEKTHELFRESQNRVRSMALIHEKLYQSEDLTRIDLGEYVLSLVSMLFRSYGTHASTVKLETRLDPVFLNIDTAIPVGLLVNELVSNSLKYAFPNGRAGMIGIDFRVLDKEEFVLSVRDNGIGLPAEFDLDKAPSLGLRLVRILATQMGGELTFQRSSGTEFTITFKEQKDREKR
jgi:PAS domain S-box-containing protein